MDIPLRERHIDTGGVKVSIHPLAQFRADAQVVVKGVAAQPQHQRIVAKVFESHERLGFVQHFGVLLGNGLQSRYGVIHIAAVGNADRHHDAQPRGGQGPVRYLAGDQILVRDHDLFILEGLDHRGPWVDVHHRAGDLSGLDNVSDADRPLEEHDKPRYKIGHDFLQAKPDAHTQSGDQPLHLHPLEAQAHQHVRDADTDRQVLKEHAQRVAAAGGHRGPFHKQHVKQGRQASGNKQGNRQHQGREQQQRQGDIAPLSGGQTGVAAGPQHHGIEQVQGRQSGRPVQPQQSAQGDEAKQSQQLFVGIGE